MSKHPNLYTEKPRNIKQKPIKEGFDDSAVATDYMYDISSKLEAGILMDWAATTDENYGTDTTGKLEAAIDAYMTFIDEMESAQ